MQRGEVWYGLAKRRSSRANVTESRHNDRTGKLACIPDGGTVRRVSSTDTSGSVDDLIALL